MENPTDVLVSAYFTPRDVSLPPVDSSYDGPTHRLRYGRAPQPEGGATTGLHEGEDKIDGLLIRDLRGSFKKNGFTVLEMYSAMSYEDFNDRQKIHDIYCKEIAAGLEEYMGTSSVYIFNINVRSDTEN